jgi:hypothetical protein
MMRAYHNDPALKERVMAKIAAHREAHRIAKGAYVDRSSGKKKHCAVGCLLEDPSGGHMRYESEFGIPVQLAWLKEDMFESLPDEHAIAWSERFMGAIEVGVELSNVWPQMAIWLMVDEQWGVVNTIDNAEVQAICCRVADGYQRAADGNPLSDKGAKVLAWDARAARDAWDARAARATQDTWAARGAVRAVRDTRAARAARATWATWDAFSLASSDKLIELLEAA